MRQYLLLEQGILCDADEGCSAFRVASSSTWNLWELVPRFWIAAKMIDTSLGMCMKTPQGRIRKADQIIRQPKEPRQTSLETLLHFSLSLTTTPSSTGVNSALAPAFTAPQAAFAPKLMQPPFADSAQVLFWGWPWAFPRVAATSRPSIRLSIVDQRSRCCESGRVA